jgi:hypothetical protein
VAEPLPFEQQTDESPQAFAAFVVYRDMGADRSLVHVSRIHNKSIATLGKWSTKHNWVERARSYDAALDARARQATEQEAIKRRRRMLDKHAKQADELGQAAQMILDEFKDRVAVRGGMKFVDARMLVQLLAQLPKMIEAGQKLERLAEGEATERHEHTITSDQILKMTDAEFDAFVREQESA